MKEMKFKIWDVEAGLMCHVYQMEWVDNQLFVYAWSKVKGHDVLRLNVDKNPLLPFTGLLDRSLVEIYVGDIICWREWGGGVNRYGQVVERVETDGSYAMRYLFNEHLNAEPVKDIYNHWDLPNMKVVGNIYENGNILKE